MLALFYIGFCDRGEVGGEGVELGGEVLVLLGGASGGEVLGCLLDLVF